MSICRITRDGFVALSIAVLLAAGAGSLRAQEKQDIPEPEDMTLETRDGVSLRCTFYPGTAKKASIPVIMVHGWEGQRSEFDSLALGLQSLGHTIIVPDLRGHGQSTVVKLPNGDSETIDITKFRPKDMESMWQDLERCKKFLLEKNNAGECNIEALCVIGAEFGSILAMHWAVRDWNAPILPAYKQGQDVKALVLLTPMQSFRGITTRDPMAHPIIRSRLSIMLVAGSEDAKGRSEAKRLFKTLESSRPKVDPDEQKQKLNLFLAEPQTSLTGTQLLSNSVKVGRGTVGTYIANFINLRLVAKLDEFEWMERKAP